MANTHPNAYLTEAQEKRDQAARLVSEAEQLETEANALLGTTDPDNKTSTTDESENTDENNAEEKDLAEAEEKVGARGFGFKKK